VERHLAIVIFMETDKMKDEGKTIEELGCELEQCRQRIAMFEATKAQCKREVQI